MSLVSLLLDSPQTSEKKTVRPIVYHIFPVNSEVGVNASFKVARRTISLSFDPLLFYRSNIVVTVGST